MWAVYDLFYYFYRNYFQSRKFSSVTNNMNNSCDILNRIQNSTERVGSLPILDPKATTRGSKEDFSLETKKSGPRGPSPFFKGKEAGANRAAKKPRGESTKTNLRG